MTQCTVYALQSGYYPDVDLRGQWRKFYHGIVTTKTCCVNNDRSLTGQWYLQSFPTSVCLNDMQASVTVWWVYNECKNFVNNIVHRILLYCQQKWLLAKLVQCIGCSIPGYLCYPQMCPIHQVRNSLKSMFLPTLQSDGAVACIIILKG